MSVYKVIIGLGNPGNEYTNTRHNVGYRALDTLIQRINPLTCQSKFNAEICEAQIEGAKVFFFKSKTYMNESGEPLGEFCRYYKIAPQEVLVMFDDVDLPTGKLRLSLGGSAGTHNGVKSVAEHLGSDFARLRIGIGDNRAVGLPSEEYVLASFKPDEREIIDQAVSAAADIALEASAKDTETIQSKIADYNKQLPQ
ncbi:MAG TPA: aminoacyl-tRNA hydrolase [Flavobacterium sp.]|nr:aminoacyl-tRNA hydrolase [Flavobacterium sp.]